MTVTNEMDSGQRILQRRKNEPSILLQQLLSCITGYSIQESEFRYRPLVNLFSDSLCKSNIALT